MQNSATAETPDASAAFDRVRDLVGRVDAGAITERQAMDRLAGLVATLPAPPIYQKPWG